MPKILWLLGLYFWKIVFELKMRLLGWDSDTAYELAVIDWYLKRGEA